MRERQQTFVVVEGLMEGLSLSFMGQEVHGSLVTHGIWMFLVDRYVVVHVLLSAASQELVIAVRLREEATVETILADGLPKAAAVCQPSKLMDLADECSGQIECTLLSPHFTYPADRCMDRCMDTITTD